MTEAYVYASDLHVTTRIKLPLTGTTKLITIAHAEIYGLHDPLHSLILTVLNRSNSPNVVFLPQHNRGGAMKSAVALTPLYSKWSLALQFAAKDRPKQYG